MYHHHGVARNSPHSPAQTERSHGREAPSGETKPREQRSLCQGDFLWFSPVSKPEWGCRAKRLAGVRKGRWTRLWLQRAGLKRVKKGRFLRSLFAQVGVLFPKPSGCAERQPIHSPASGTDECKRAVQEGARDSLSLVCRGGHPAEHPGCVVFLAAEAQRRPRPRVVFFSLGGVRRASARESPCQTPVVGRQRVAGGSGVALSLRVGSRPREASRRARQRDLTESRVTKNTASATPHHKRACACDWRARQTPHRLRTRKRNRTSHPHGFTHLLTRSLTHSLTSSTARRAAPHSAHENTHVHAAPWLFSRGLKDRVGVFVPCRSVQFTFTKGTYMDNPDVSSFSQTGLRFPVGFFNSQLVLSWSIPMMSCTRAVVVTRWAENWRSCKCKGAEYNSSYS